MKRIVLAASIVLWLFTPKSFAQCPQDGNIVYYNYLDQLYSIDLVTGEEVPIITSLPDSINGVFIDRTPNAANLPMTPASNILNSLAANADGNGFIYFANESNVFGYDITNDSLFHVSDLSTYPGFSGGDLDSGGGAYFEGRYYVGSDCDGIYSVDISDDGYSATGLELFVTENFQYGDLVVLSAGCSGLPTMYVGTSPATGDNCTGITARPEGLYMIDLVTKAVTQVAGVTYPGQLAVTAEGKLFKGSGTTIQEIDICTGADIGSPLAPSPTAVAIYDMTGPGICPQAPSELIAEADFDTIPGYNTLTIDVAANDPPEADPSTINIKSNPANGSYILSGTNISYTPDFGFTGYDTIQYCICLSPAAVKCDTTIAVFAIGDDHDMDGLLDVNECPNWDLSIGSCDIDGDNLPNIYDVDSDNDSILDQHECPTYSGTVGTCDTDDDGAPDYLDTDSDDDGLDDALECPSWAGAASTCDTDLDGIPNFRDIDSDGDGILDGTFNEFPTNDCDDDSISDYLDPDACGICIPEGFSPNGDGRNDFFEIVGVETLLNTRLKVFNRWGEEVFDQVNYQNTWAGDNQGKQEVLKGDLLPVGTYYVIFEYESLGSKFTYDGICYIQY